DSQVLPINIGFKREVEQLFVRAGLCPRTPGAFLEWAKKVPKRTHPNENSKRIARSAAVDFRNLPLAEYLYIRIRGFGQSKILNLWPWSHS
ncbi:MAG: hypothetical protein WAV13_07720, partial [Thermodesulfovibrionales bacterium]